MHTVRNLRSNKLNCTEKILLSLKLLGKRSFKWGITWWGLTTHKANMGRGWGRPLFYLHRPTALLAWPVERPYQVTPLFLTSFPQRFQFCHYFSSTICYSLISLFWRYVTLILSENINQMPKIKCSELHFCCTLCEERVFSLLIP